MNNTNDIEKNMKELLKKFIKIKNKNLCKSLRKGTGGMGYTFESLIDKIEDSNYLPDYKGIEIKTKYGYTTEPLALFSMAPKRDDGIVYSKFILDNFGYNISEQCTLKKFMGNIYYKCFEKSKNNYFFKTVIDNYNNKLKLVVYDKNYNLIDDKTYWNLSDLKERLYTKLNYLALIKGYPYKKNNEIYYRYTNLEFLELISFNSFLDLIRISKIHISFNITTINQPGKNFGKIIDKGATFRLKMDSIDTLFKKYIFLNK